MGLPHTEYSDCYKCLFDNRVIDLERKANDESLLYWKVKFLPSAQWKLKAIKSAVRKVYQEKENPAACKGIEHCGKFLRMKASQIMPNEAVVFCPNRRREYLNSFI